MSDDIKWYEYKKMYTANKDSQCMFHVYFSTDKRFIVLFETNESHKYVFNKILTGKMILYKKNNDPIIIDYGNPFLNLEKYIEICNLNKHGNRFILQEISRDIVEKLLNEENSPYYIQRLIEN